MQSASVPCGAAASTPQDLQGAGVALERSRDVGRDSFGKDPSRLSIILSAFGRASWQVGKPLPYPRTASPAVQNETRSR
jgi:hypothetical protein